MCGVLAASDCVLEPSRRELLHEVGACERLRRQSAVVVEQLEALPRQPPPVPAEVAEVEIGEVDDVGAAEHEGGEQREEEGGLLDEIAVASNDARDERGKAAVARQVP